MANDREARVSSKKRSTNRPGIERFALENQNHRLDTGGFEVFFMISVYLLALMMFTRQ